MIIPFKTSIYWDFAGGHPWKADAAVTTRRLQVWLGCKNSPKNPVIYVPAFFWPAELAQRDSYCFPANMAPLRISTPMCWRRGRGPRWFSLGWHLFAHWIPKKNALGYIRHKMPYHSVQASIIAKRPIVSHTHWNILYEDAEFSTGPWKISLPPPPLVGYPIGVPKKWPMGFQDCGGWKKPKCSIVFPVTVEWCGMSRVSLRKGKSVIEVVRTNPVKHFLNFTWYPPVNIQKAMENHYLQYIYIYIWIYR